MLTAVSGDFNRDGIADLAVADPTQSVNNLANAGIVKIIYGRPFRSDQKGFDDYQQPVVRDYNARPERRAERQRQIWLGIGRW